MRILKRTAIRQRRLEEANLKVTNVKEFFKYARRRLNQKEQVAPLKFGDGIAIDVDKAAVLLRCFTLSPLCSAV